MASVRRGAMFGLRASRSKVPRAGMALCFAFCVGEYIKLTENECGTFERVRKTACPATPLGAPKTRESHLIRRIRESLPPPWLWHLNWVF